MQLSEAVCAEQCRRKSSTEVLQQQQQQQQQDSFGPWLCIVTLWLSRVTKVLIN